jgi:mRNA interferase HicA
MGREWNSSLRSAPPTHERQRTPQETERIAEARNVTIRFKPRRGKGSHGTLFFGDKFTVMPDVKRELKPGTLHGILSKFGLTKADLKTE